MLHRYACDPPPAFGRGAFCALGNATRNAELRIELGRQDLYSARKPSKSYWNGVRLPVGYIRLVLRGKMLAGSMRLSLHNAEIHGILQTTLGTISFRLLTHATEIVHMLEVNVTGLESVSFVLVPLTKCVDRVDVLGLINCTLTPNPAALCTQRQSTTGSLSTPLPLQLQIPFLWSPVHNPKHP